MAMAMVIVMATITFIIITTTVINNSTTITIKSIIMNWVNFSVMVSKDIKEH